MVSAKRPSTITDAIVEVLRAAKRPMTLAEILQGIEQEKLYAFNAKSPSSVVATQLRRHTQDANLKIAARVKLFGRSPDGRYYLLDMSASTGR